MKLTQVAVIAVLIWSGVIGPKVYAVSSKSEVIYKQGYQAETVDRDPLKAIDFYKKVIAEDGDQGAMTAKAHLRLGICYEKLNRTSEASASFKDVLEMSEAPQNLVQEAKEHLQRLQPAPSVPSTAAEPVERSTWQRGLFALSFQGGASFTGVNYGYPFDMRQETAPLYQFSLLYEASNWVTLGLETAIPFKHEGAHPSMNRTYRKIFQLTPEVQIGRWIGKTKPYLTFGGGLYRVSDHIDADIFSPTLGTIRVMGSDTRNLGGINGGLGCLFRIGNNFAMGPDLRYHNIFESGEDYWYGSATVRLALLF